MGPESARPAALVEALAPFVPFEDRPVVVDAGPRSISLPHETGVTLRPTDREREGDFGRRTRDLTPDVTILPTIAADESLQYLGEALAAGRGVLAAATAADAPALGSVLEARGIPPATVANLDLVIETATIDGEPRVTGLRVPTRTAGDRSLD